MKRLWFYEMELDADEQAPPFLKLWYGGIERTLYRWSSRPNDEDFADQVVDIVLGKMADRITRWLKRDL